MSDRLIVVYTAANPGLANIMKSALEAAGIPAETSREGAGAALGLTVGPLAQVDILVPEANVAEARALLAAIERGDLNNDDDSIPDEA